MEPIKAIIFDWDNTIINSFDDLLHYHQEVGHLLGWPPVSDEQIRAVWGRPFEELIRTLWPTHAMQDFRAAYQQYILGQCVSEIKGATTTIATLKESFLLSILTAAPRFEVEHFLAQLRFKETDFFLIQTADDSSHYKPDPQVFDKLIEALQEQRVGIREILYVGDSVTDFYAARSAALRFTAVLTGSSSREQFCRAGVRTQNILSSIVELPAWLGQQSV
ncbi:MAG TPA: HAD family hydrolase [Ktedonobacteraceae bacterium]|nr:HAD family hydrolase [Ktedonobacteraceae bacterium]